MTPLTIRNRFQGNNTLIENDFIDHYMIEANGEYVKVYLLLLRYLNNPSASLTISTIADCLEDTEKDVMRALKYWAKKGLLTIEYDQNKRVIGLDIGHTVDLISSPVPEVANIVAIPSSEPMVLPQKTPHTVQTDKDFKDVLFATECYLGKTLTKTDLQTMQFFYDQLQFSTDLIEYLIEYCVDNGHKSMRYIKSVAIAWSENGISTVKQAKADVASHSRYNKDCNAVMKAYGITGRFAGTSELSYIRKWTKEYGFTLELIEEACKRTLASTHQPSFPHTDAILKSWLEQKVQSLEDIQTLDEAFQSKKKANLQASADHASSKKSTGRFNNFEGRSYDMDDLEKRLLNTN